jgi:FG-GAP-like repeat
VSPGSTVTDVDDLDLVAGGVRIVDGAFDGDILSVNGLQNGTFLGIDFSYDPVSHILSYTRPTSIADYQAFVQAIQFSSSNDDPTNGGLNPTRTLGWATFDGAAVSNVPITTIDVTPVNDAPDVAVPASYAGTAADPVVIDAITFSDVDGGATNEVAIFTVGAGTFAAANGGGVTVSGSGTGTLTLTGSLASLNAFIAGGALAYTGSQDDTLNVTIDDQGNTGGGALSDSAAVPITIAPQDPTDGDADGDGFGDLLLHRDAGEAAIWPMHENVRQGDGTNLPNNGPTWHPKAFVDLDATGGFSDIVWQNDNGLVATWRMEGATIVDQINLPNPGPATHVVDADDFDGNGGADILLQNDDGTLALWFMQDATHFLPSGQVTIDQNPGAPWHALAGDFNGDGKSGVVFTTANGGTAIWEDHVSTSPGQGHFNLQGNLQDNGPTWHLMATGDFDGDHKDDLLWQNDNGLAAVWLMDGMQIRAGYTVAGSEANGPTWHTVVARDMNGDDRADIIWQNDNGAVAIWENFTPGSGTTASFATQLNVDPEVNPTGELFWHVV